MYTYTIRYNTSTGGQEKMDIQADSSNRAKQKFQTLYPNVKILGMSGGK
jgi:hypothetical protein